MRIMRDATAFLFGLAIVGLLACCYLNVKARSAEPQAQTYIGIIVGYAEGKVIGSQAIGYAASQDACIKGVLTMIAQSTPKAGVSLAALCTVAPPAPPTSTVTPQSPRPLPGKSQVDRL